MRTRWTWFVLVLVFLLQFLLHGCRANALDPETQAMAEDSDAVCFADVDTAYIYSHGDWEPRGDRTVLRCEVREDFLGDISTRGRDVNRNDGVIVYVAVDSDWFTRVYKPLHKQDPSLGLILFLDLQEEDYQDGKWDERGKWDLFVLHGGEENIRWETKDGAGLRYLEALRAYGKKHPQAAESWTFQYPEGIWYTYLDRPF